MARLELLDTTGDPRCDRVVEGLLGVFELVFPGRTISCYLRGSRARGVSIDGSDLDLYLIFKGRFADHAEAERARELTEHCARIATVVLEVVLIGERRLDDPDSIDAAVDIKLGTRLLWGEDLRQHLPDFNSDQYVRAVVDTPYYSYSFPKERGDHLLYPLAHLDPESEFYGFEQWSILGPDGVDVPSTKLLVGTVCWTATAIVALRAGVYVRDKAASVQLYGEQVADEWEDLVTTVYELCRNTWRYLIPTDHRDRSRLRALCDQTLRFQNHYLELYLEYHLAELDSGDPVRQLAAAERLGRIVFPSDRVTGALEALKDSEHDALAQSVSAILAARSRLS